MSRLAVRLAWSCWLLAIAGRILAATSPERVEALYARGIYRYVSSALALLAASAPFSWAEVLLVCAGAGAGLVLLRSLGALRSGQDRARILRSLLHALVAGLGPVYLAFLLLWGLNYQRRPFAASAGLDASPASRAELESLCRRLVAEADDGRAALVEDTRGVMRVEGGLASVVARLPRGFEAAARRHDLLAGPLAPAKPVRLSPVLSYLGISGVFCPFTGEPNVNTTLPDPELPFVVAHETAHQRGLAREDEANYVASLACRLHDDADFRYSGSLIASLHALAALRGIASELAAEIGRTRSAPVRRDLRALQEWTLRYQSPLRRVGEAVNDGYLRSQGQRDGVRSYGRMVDLLIAEERAERK